MSWKIAVLSGVLGLGALGCQDAPQVKPDDKADAGPQTPIADTHIADAMASVASTANPQSPATDDGPPPNGVFQPGEADRRVPAGTPPAATIIDKGSEPLAKWLPLMTFTDTQLFDVSLIRAEGQGGIAVKFTLAASLPVAEVEGKDDKKGAGGGAAEAPKPEPITQPTAIQFIIQKVGVHDQLANVPEKELAPLMDKLKTLAGTRIAAVLEPNGALTKETFELAKGADEGAVEAVRALVETLGLFFSPYPTEPLGQGAYWITSDRGSLAGLDLLRYRVTKLEQLEGDQTATSVDLRLYAASPKTLPKGAPEGGLAVQFQGQGKATITRKKGQILPVQGNLKSPLALQYAASADAQMGQMYQLQNVVDWTPHKPKDEKPKTP